MNKQRKTSHILNVFQYDETTGAVTLPASLSLASPDSADNSTKVATTAWIRTYIGSLSYATSASVTTAIANLVASAPTTLDTLNELATALGNDPNFATTISTSIGTKVPQARTITINGTAYDLSADRAWTIASGVTSFNTRTGAITLSSGDVTGALGYTPYNSSNPSGYITGITSGNVTTALGYTPYNSSNPSGYITGITSGMVTTALGYTPYNSTNPAGYVTGSGSVNYASSAGTSSQVTINYSNDSNSTYQMLWGSGNSVYGTGGVYINPYIDTIYAYGYRGSGNVGGTGEASWHPAGIYSGGTQWLYGTTYRNSADTYGQGNIYFDSNYGYGMVGLYASTRYQAIFAMGNAYKIATDGTTIGNLYGLAWSHPNAGGQAGYLNDHGLIVGVAGLTYAAISSNIWARGSISANANLNATNGYCYASGSIRLGDMWNSTGGLYRPSGIMCFGTENEGWRFSMANSQKAYIGTDGNLWMAWSGEYLSTTLGRKAVHRGEGENYVDYSRYVYNNGAYSGSGWIEPSDLGVRYANSANRCNYLDTQYAGGVQGNPQVYFNNGIGLKVAMTGAWSVWSDTLWINGYAGGDVPWMCALHFLRNSEPRFAISAQTQGSGGYGSYYEVITDYNIGSRKADGSKKLWATSHPNDYYIVNNWTGSYWQLTTNHGSPVQVGYSDNSGTASNLSGFDKTNPTFDAVYANNWFRAYGDCGLYSQSYGAHIRRNTYSYGNWEIFGYAKNGYTGIVTINNYVTAQMHNSSGDFGFLTENGNWWNLFYNNGNNCWGIGTDNTYSGDGFRCVKYGSSQYGWTTWSDRRAKENIKNITGALDTVLAMRGVYFNYINDAAKNKRVGFIAQELELVLPEAVRYAEEIDEYNVEYAQIVSVLTEAIKEQDVQMKVQDAKILRLEQLVEQLINQ